MNKIEKRVIIITLLPGVWLFLSWCDVLAHNTTDFIYSSWNLFNLFL